MEDISFVACFEPEEVVEVAVGSGESAAVDTVEAVQGFFGRVGPVSAMRSSRSS